MFALKHDLAPIQSDRSLFVGRTVKNEIDHLQKKAGMEAISYTTWDDTLGQKLSRLLGMSVFMSMFAPNS